MGRLAAEVARRVEALKPCVKWGGSLNARWRRRGRPWAVAVSYLGWGSGVCGTEHYWAGGWLRWDRCEELSGGGNTRRSYATSRLWHLYLLVYVAPVGTVVVAAEAPGRGHPLYGNRVFFSISLSTPLILLVAFLLMTKSAW